jgi:hypothetical protein
MVEIEMLNSLLFVQRAETFNSCRTIDFQMAKFLREIIGAKASL